MVVAGKRELRTAVRRIEKIKTWQLVVLLIMASFVAATFLRLNNVGMIERREAVFAADREGDKELAAKRLYALQRYVSSHMNADPGRIALDNIYNIDNQKKNDEAAQAAASSSSNNVVAQIRQYCDTIGRQQGWRWLNSASPQYLECINSEWEKYPPAPDIQAGFEPIPTGPYYHSFVSPIWSPDFAGWSVLACLVIVLFILGRLLTLAVLRIMLKLRYRRV